MKSIAGRVWEPSGSCRAAGRRLEGFPVQLSFSLAVLGKVRWPPTHTAELPFPVPFSGHNQVLEALARLTTGKPQRKWLCSSQPKNWVWRAQHLTLGPQGGRWCRLLSRQSPAFNHTLLPKVLNNHRVTWLSMSICEGKHWTSDISFQNVLYSNCQDFYSCTLALCNPSAGPAEAPELSLLLCSSLSHLYLFQLS